MTAAHGIATYRHGGHRQAILESLLEGVLRGTFQAGQHLVTQTLAEQYGVSHTPIREALIALAGIGVVDLPPNRGAIVRQVTPKDIREVCQVRRVLECEAARQACGRIDLTELHALAQELEQLAIDAKNGGSAVIEQARESDSRLHDLVAASSGNAFLANELNRLKLLFRAFRDMAWRHDDSRHDYHRLAEEAREHLAIVQALIAGNGKEAAREMSHHIRSGLKYWSRALPTSRSISAANGKQNTHSNHLPRNGKST
jgi:DNA-binding GntR family transcriptional regulator